MQNIDTIFLQMKRPKDPYAYIDRKTQNIQINPGVVYKSTSNDEVLEPRIHKLRQEKITNAYLKLIDPNEEIDTDFAKQAEHDY